jgi:hypothetical protein
MADNTNGKVGMSGEVGFKKLRNLGHLEDLSPKGPGWGWKVRNFVGGHYRGVLQNIATDLSGRLIGNISIKSRLSGFKFSPDWSVLNPEQMARLRELLALNTDVRQLAGAFRSDIVDYGTLSYRVVTDTGVAFLANNFAAGGQTILSFKYHGFGTGTGVEGAGDTALGTELTTEYAVNSTRPTGSQSSSTNVYTTVGTLSPDSGGTLAITEHGIFSATSSGTLWDRSKFSAVNLVAGSDSLQVTYNLTCSSGG